MSRRSRRRSLEARALGVLSPQARRYLLDQRPLGPPGPLTPTTARVLRRLRERAAARVRDDVAARLGVTAGAPGRVAGVDVVELRPAGAAAGAGDGAGRDGPWALYLHGGAYVVGQAHDTGAVVLADALGLPVRSVEYPLAPEHPHPAPLDAVERVWRALAERHPGPAVLLGVSAGGGLALGLVDRLRRTDGRLPDVVGLVSPWADLEPVGDSHVVQEGRDPVVRWRRQLDRCAKVYADGRAPDEPELSPVHLDLAAPTRRHPPVVVTTATRDLFLSPCVRLHARLVDAGVDAELQVDEGMWHAHTVDVDVPESERGRRLLAAALRAHLTGSPRPPAPPG